MAGNSSVQRRLAPQVAENRWSLIRALRSIKDEFGLKAAHVNLLEVMLRLLKPDQGEVIFASNRTLADYAGGISERTLRRYTERLALCGFIERQDSPNGKRYRLRSQDEILSFGFSLTPLFERSSEIMYKAGQRASCEQACKLLKAKIQTILKHIELEDPDNLMPEELRRKLRRKLGFAALQNLYDELVLSVDNFEAPRAQAKKLTASDSQTDRHQSISETEQKYIDSDEAEEPVSLAFLNAACREASAFYTEGPPQDWSAVYRSSKSFAKMLGIEPSVLDEAIQQHGNRNVAMFVYYMLEVASDIGNSGAYFRTATLGKGAASFAPARLIQNLATRSVRASSIGGMNRAEISGVAAKRELGSWRVPEISVPSRWRNTV
ncbi:plasmid replication protein RepC [Salipiger sp. 1_MG-2023]|uniref:plasmid replication protein RepC n=1 Tax=Salipiger sp. 1_MG-2023 TaxID=3062665 RepID=UPI0026E17D8D|nr:plasmid replication protein RepC [Salipiger sp. 1_MG-2023]MDO6587476.1 plasmid replication protein RepC [Salipiger sp. 1_MG-2023]